MRNKLINSDWIQRNINAHKKLHLARNEVGSEGGFLGHHVP
jgi:hypothetical protein